MDKYGLLQFKEFGCENGPSIKSFFAENKYEHQEEIAKYLDNSKIVSMAPEYDKDIISGELIKPLQSKAIRTNGVFSWDSSLSFYVRKYNFKLPSVYEEFILESKM